MTMWVSGTGNERGKRSALPVSLSRQMTAPQMGPVGGLGQRQKASERDTISASHGNKQDFSLSTLASKGYPQV